MSKILYPIFNLPNEHDAENESIPSWIKWWLLNNYNKKHSWILSEIITGNPLTLENSVETKFYLPPLPRGNSEQGSTATAYEPYVGGTTSPNPSYPQAITNVTGDVEVLVQNKNLFDEHNVEFITGVLDDNGNPTGSTASHYTNNFYKVNSNTDYIISGTLNSGSSSGRIYFYDKNKNWISRSSGFSGNSKVFTTPVDCCYVRIQVTITINLNSGDVQLEQNTTATTYTPHKEQTLPLTLGNIELCKIGDNQDYFYKENSKWYLYKAIGKLILNGSEEWNVWNLSSETNQRFYLNLDVSKASLTDNVGTMLCNRFQIVKSTSADIEHYTFSATASHYSQPLIIINRSRLSTVDVAGFKTWLSSNNVVVYYQLETPTSTEITDTTLIEQLDAISQAISYEEQTNISGSSSEVEPLFEVQYYMINESEGE